MKRDGVSGFECVWQECGSLVKGRAGMCLAIAIASSIQSPACEFVIRHETV